MSRAASSRPGGSSPLLRTIHISKSYAGNRVLADVSFALAPGESVAIIGENGAGKSTFAKVLAGAIRHDDGILEVNGKAVSFHSPRDALRHGIAFIPQELAYVPHMTVAENILLGQWPSWRGVTSHGSATRGAQRECERYGIELDVRRLMTTLKLADRQIVEIIKALARRAQAIVLDEPTASLSQQESCALFAVLQRLTDAGVGIIYISHRMDEVYEFSDRVVVFRNGELVASVAPAQSTPAQLIAHMLGQEKEEFIQSARRVARDDAVVELRGWTRDGFPPLSHVSLSVAQDEIVGVYGLRGSGADLVAEGLAGLRPEIDGELRLNGTKRAIFATPFAACRARVAYVPPERKRDGLVLILSIQSNLVLLILRLVSRFGILRRRQEAMTAQDLAARFDVRCRTLRQPLGQLSGGNQQKVLLASRMAAHPQLLVLQEPTRGVDVGARMEIHRFLTDIARQGCAVLLVTSDVEESVIVSDRLIVMRDGAIVGELSGTSKTQASAIALAAGKAA